MKIYIDTLKSPYKKKRPTKSKARFKIFLHINKDRLIHLLPTWHLLSDTPNCLPRSHFATCQMKIQSQDPNPIWSLTSSFSLQLQICSFSKQKALRQATMASLATLAAVQPVTVKGLGGSSLAGAKLPLRPSRQTFRPKNFKYQYNSSKTSLISFIFWFILI